MMSQQRTRKTGGAGVEATRGRQSVGKASGDSMPPNVQAKQPTVRSTSKSKIPKNLRYDLENALVGLCDVWFGEIKPHLVRNNIKVHVHGGAGPASGDYQRLPPGAPGCSHLDPALSAGSCELCRLLFNAANSIESAVSQAACTMPAGLPAGLVASEAAGLPSVKIPRNSLARRKLRPGTQPLPHDFRTWQKPRLCRTYSILTPRTQPERRLHIADAKMSRRKLRRPKMIDKSTQTPVLWKSEVLPFWDEPWNQDLLWQNLTRQEELYKQKLLRQDLHRPEPSRMKSTSPSCLRSPATTNMQRSRRQPSPQTPLFQDDLINIIVEKNDKQLRVLFQSPRRDEELSSLNLVRPKPARRSAAVKKTPWR